MWTEAREIEKHYIRTTLIITSHWLLFVENVSLSIPSGIQANKSQGTNTFSESGSPECSNVNYSWQHCNVDGNMAIDTRIRTTQKKYTILVRYLKHSLNLQSKKVLIIYLNLQLVVKLFSLFEFEYPFCFVYFPAYKYSKYASVTSTYFACLHLNCSQ